MAWELQKLWGLFVTNTSVQDRFSGVLWNRLVALLNLFNCKIHKSLALLCLALLDHLHLNWNTPPPPSSPTIYEYMLFLWELQERFTTHFFLCKLSSIKKLSMGPFSIEICVLKCIEMSSWTKRKISTSLLLQSIWRVC